MSDKNKFTQTAGNYFILHLFLKTILCLLLAAGFHTTLNGQVSTQSMTGFFAPGSSSSNPSSNYMKNSAAFRQEIMRMEINVVRGAKSLPITQVPRVQKNDVIKVRILDEAIGGIRPSESYWDWTFLVAFVNPNRRNVPGQDKQQAVSQEIRFKKTGWYKYYSFQVPYDSQPVFFLYPKANYRSKILKVVTRNYNEVRKLGEKTIEIAGAYSQISSFLNELQYVLYQTQTSRYYNSNGVPGFGGGSYLPGTGNTGSNPYNPYGNNYAPYPNPTPTPYNPYGSYYPTPTPTPTSAKPQKVEIPVNYNYFVEQTIERMARSFNLQLPACWGPGSSYGSYGGSYGGYSSTYGSSTYSPSYGSTYGSSYGSGTYGSYNSFGMNNANNFGYAVSQELFARAQCVAKNIRLEDFDLSVASMLQQGGIMLASHLRDKYPQLSYWINLAAAAIDFIVKVFQRAALRIMPTIVQTSDGSGNSYSNSSSLQPSYAMQSGYTTNFTAPSSSSSPSAYGSMNSGTSVNSANSVNSSPVKISLYAESQPDNMQFVTAYPVVVHKWQAEPDPEVISIPPPVLAEPCLHQGINILKNTMIGDEPEGDNFTRDFKLTMTAPNGFRKEFSLKKNVGLGGWELNLTKEDLSSFPKIEMTLQSEISGTRGFNEIKSPPFNLPLPLGGSYEVTPESQKAFAVGGKRIVTLKNSLGGCRCLQAVIYKPSFGGQFVYEANSKDRSNQLHYSPDGKEVSFEIDASTFQPGAGQLILAIYGGEQATVNLKLYPPPPNITNIKMARGDNQAIISGERLEQLQFVKINGRRATVAGNQTVKPGQGSVGSQPQTTNGNTGTSFNVNQNPLPPSPPANQIPAVPNQSTPSTAPNTAPSTAFPSSILQAVNQIPNQNANKGVSGIPNGSGSQTVTPMPSPVPSPTSGPLTSYPQSVVAAPLPALTPSSSSSLVTAPSSLAGNERLVVFDDQTAKLTENSITLELGLEDDRTFPLSQVFPSNPSRPAIVTGQNNEIEGTTFGADLFASSGYDLQALKGVILPVGTSEIALNVENKLTDYDFRVENLSIETRLEKSESNASYAIGYGTENIKATFEVLDWKNLRVSLQLNDQIQKMLGGRRIQFRIRDRMRGDSDWYTIKQTFVRIPKIEAVRCTEEMKGMCEMTGASIDYIAQVSVDGGAKWFPEGANTLQIKPTADGGKSASIPHYVNKKLLTIKFRDYPQMPSVAIGNYIYSNSNKPVKKVAQ